MKIIDVPQTGKLGLVVAFQGRNGLIRRIKAIPKQPNTFQQMAVRSRLTLAAAGFDLLTEAQQDAWNDTAAKYRSKATLGQSGPLTGLQLFVKINTNLNYLGQESVIDPPAVPIFDAVAPQNLSITLVLGVPKITLTCPTSPGEDTVISACAPVNSGIRRAPQLKILGTCPAPVQGSANITALYEAMFGVPALGSRIFASAHKMTNGWTSPTSLFSGLVPRV